MRYTLVLALFCGCLCAAPAAADPVTKRNNDATLRAPYLRAPPVYRPSRRVLEPSRPDSAPER